jgi:hypothetical protein
MRQALSGLPAYFLGYQGDAQLAPLYASSDLFVFPSRTDTLGQVVMEAQASGLPALVSNEGGPKEVVDDNVTGVTLATADAPRWVAAIDDLLNDEPRRLRLSRARVAARRRQVLAGANLRRLLVAASRGDRRPGRRRSHRDARSCPLSLRERAGVRADVWEISRSSNTVRPISPHPNPLPAGEGTRRRLPNLPPPYKPNFVFFPAGGYKIDCMIRGLALFSRFSGCWRRWRCPLAR